MSILMQLFRELLAFRRIFVGGEEVPQRAAVEYGDGVQCADDPERDRTVLHFAFAPASSTSESGNAQHQISAAPAVHFIDGLEPTVTIVLPRAQLCEGRTVTIVDVGESSRYVTLQQAPGELDTIDGGLDPKTFYGVGVSLQLVAYPGNAERRMGWHITSMRHRS